MSSDRPNADDVGGGRLEHDGKGDRLLDASEDDFIQDSIHSIKDVLTRARLYMNGTGSALTPDLSSLREKSGDVVGVEPLTAAKGTAAADGPSNSAPSPQRQSRHLQRHEAATRRTKTMTMTKTTMKTTLI